MIPRIVVSEKQRKLFFKKKIYLFKLVKHHSIFEKIKVLVAHTTAKILQNYQTKHFNLLDILTSNIRSISSKRATF